SHRNELVHHDEPPLINTASQMPRAHVLDCRPIRAAIGAGEGENRQRSEVDHHWLQRIGSLPDVVIITGTGHDDVVHWRASVTRKSFDPKRIAAMSFAVSLAAALLSGPSANASSFGYQLVVVRRDHLCLRPHDFDRVTGSRAGRHRCGCSG